MPSAVNGGAPCVEMAQGAGKRRRRLMSDWTPYTRYSIGVSLSSCEYLVEYVDRSGHGHRAQAQTLALHQFPSSRVGDDLDKDS